MLIQRTNGWTYDTATGMLTWPGVAEGGPLPEVTLVRFVYNGMMYDESAAAARTVNGVFKKAYADAKGIKVSEVPKGTDYMPATDSAEYKAELLTAHKALFARFLDGYEVGVREGSGDPVEDEVAKLARVWLQGLAVAKGWFVLPAKRKVAKDDDAYSDPKGRYATFGQAVEAFAVSTFPALSAALVQKDDSGKSHPWPFKMRQGESIKDALRREAERVVADRAKATKPVLAASEDVEI
jgi:hypothetical protein